MTIVIVGILGLTLVVLGSYALEVAECTMYFGNSMEAFLGLGCPLV